MKKKHNIRKIIIIAIVLILLFFIIGYFLYKKQPTEGLKEIIESLDCIYYGEYTSSEEGIDTDIVIGLKTMPIDDKNLISNQYYYETLIKAVSTKMQGKVFRLIDEKNNIFINIKENEKKVSYTINGSNNYFETEIAKLSKRKEEKQIKLNIKSEVLNTLIKNDWGRAQSREILGTADKHENDYDYYNEKGYYLRTINTKIFNFVFTKKYQDEVFEGIKTGLSNREIKKILGAPEFENEDAEMLIGYKTNNFYVFFCQGEISIYKYEKEKEEDNKAFSDLVTELNEKKNYDEFLKNLTELYPDYLKYTRDETGTELLYPQRGFKVEINNYKKGITFFNNYKGKITNSISSENIQSIDKLPRNLFFSTYNSFFDYELNRIEKI
ncbi:MAG: hypothetical protein IKG14_03675 [Clostridia bacterium]|nr:hypothetical protein [Clostridia bacterium]